MVQYPDGYTMRKQFLAALRKPLRCEVLLQGHTAEFSRGAELTLAAERVENAMRYDVGTWHPDALNSNMAAQARLIPARVRTSTMVWPYPNQGIRPRDVVGRGPPMNAQAKPFAQQGDAGQPEASRWKPTVNVPAANAGSKQAGPPVCYECKQPGHIRPDCPNLRGKSRINAACVEETEQDDEAGHHP